MFISYRLSQSNTIHPGDPTCNIDEPDRVANELAHAIDTDSATIESTNFDSASAIDTERDSTHFDNLSNVERLTNAANLNERIDSRDIKSGTDSAGIDVDRGSNQQLDRDSTHFAEDVVSVHTDKFELIGDRTHTSTTGSQDR